MADALGRARKKFVDKSSTDLIGQLLDDLLEDGIVNDGEKDYVTQANSTTANQARCLIDKVKKKGDRASLKMIAHIQTRDPILYCELDLCRGNCQNCAAKTKTDQDLSDTLVLITEAFWREKQNNEEIYPVTKANTQSRVALLITNITFCLEKNNRRGAEKDEENMETLLTALGYEVVKHTNLTAQAMDRALSDFSKLPKLKETDSVVVVMSSHGKRGTVLGVDSNPEEKNPDGFLIDKLYEHLGSEKCPALLNKPKIIIIQACRGGHSGSVLVSDDMEEDAFLYGDVHKEKDFISLLSSTPDTVSYRQPTKGSLLIQYIVSQFNQTAREDDIEELFRKVMQRFEGICPGNIRQMPTKDRCTLTKRFYFYPGLKAL